MLPARTPTYTADWEKHEPDPSGYEYRFGTHSNDTKSEKQNAHFVTMSAAAALVRQQGSKAFVPQDLELFHASQFQQRVTFRGYDKITTNPPSHKTLPAWTIRPELRAKLEKGL